MAMDLGEDLLWPGPDLVQAWWDQNKGRFKKGTRYLCGKPISRETAEEVLKNGFQRQRLAAAIELALLQPGSHLFECRAPGFRQQQRLGTK